eukprot:1762822-Prymnesium_polylepis.1
MGVRREEIVNIAAQYQLFLTSAGGPVSGSHEGEDALVGVILCETVVEEPWEKTSLPSPACLGHAVARFFDAEHAGTAVSAQVGN